MLICKHKEHATRLDDWAVAETWRINLTVEQMENF